MHFFAPWIPTQKWIKSKLIRNYLFCVRLDLLHIFYAFTGFQLHLVLFQFEVDMLYLNWHFQTGDNISPSGLRASVVQGDDDTLLQHHIDHCQEVLSYTALSGCKVARDADTLGIPSSWGGIVEIPWEKGEQGEGRGLVEGFRGFSWDQPKDVSMVCWSWNICQSM